MGLEIGTFIDDLVITNPPGNDDKRQGDDHLRLIKTVLRNTIKRASKAFFLPGSVTKSTNYTVLDTDENLTIQCDTTAGAFTLSLPVLDLTRAGWTLNVVKASTDMNPVFLLPPGAGTINGFSKIRRSVAATITQVIWTGNSWVASRPLGTPIGSTVEYYGTNLPQGHLWADGSAIVAANYVELTGTVGANTPDRRGRLGVGRDNMGGAAANRVTTGGSGIAGTTLLSAGGLEAFALSVAQLPSHNHQTLSQHFGGSMSVAAEDTDHAHSWGGTFGTSDIDRSLDHTHQYGTPPGGGFTGGGGGFSSGGGSFTTSGTSIGALNHTHTVSVGGTTGGRNAAHAHAISGTTQPTGSTASIPNMPPSLVCNVIVVAE